ncbi:MULTISPECIES: aquaporin [unclassified Arthrobacter]|uniref:aquaporin n=1 Tax=unclassified Arthrobacter TaxID=235627 RepID=UPI001E65C166|nr:MULTISPECIES: aquaporin [unclassified Arthrobacter]MCC9146587.1 aquaporin [Arthrobacter sp. zg-Y919]MDK1277817.1 aquaporin [Arthrobacter sp. zg.Y919]WIB02228.1 aquaporin [Arthrobacter sp. zg-Y919]
MSSESLPLSGARAVAPARGAAPANGGHTYGLVGRSVAEAIGSFLLLFVGIGIAIFGSSTGGGITSPLAFGLALAAAMVAFGYVSGGHFNPAITLGSAVAGRTPWKFVLPYIVAQLVGAGLGVAILWVVITGHEQIGEQARQFMSGTANGYGEHSVNLFPLASALLMEVIAGALLAAVFLGAASRRPGTDARRSLAVKGAFAVGVTYAVLLTVLAPVTNGGINPARSTAVAFFAEGWALEQLWLFWVAPLLGAVIAGLIFRSVDMTVDAHRSDAVVTDDAAAAADTTPAVENDAAAKPAAKPAKSAVADSSKPEPVVDEEARGFFDKPGTGTGTARPEDGTPGNRA